MATFFLSKKSIRQETAKLKGSDISGATPAAPKLFTTLQRSGRMYSFKNTTNVILRLYVINPENEAQDLIEWIELDPGETFGTDTAATPQQFSIPAQTQIYVTGVDLDGVAANPASGRIRFFSWG